MFFSLALFKAFKILKEGVPAKYCAPLYGNRKLKKKSLNYGRGIKEN